MSTSDRPKAEYDSESELLEDYKKLVISNPINLNIATEHLFESLVDEAVMGYCFQMHFEAKLPVNLGQFLLKKLVNNFCNFRKCLDRPLKNLRSTAHHLTATTGLEITNSSTANV